MLALNETDAVPPKLAALHEIVAAKPAEATGGWTFEGTQHFISQHKTLAAYPWLPEMLAAIQGQDGTAVLVAIEKAQAAFGRSGQHQ